MIANNLINEFLELIKNNKFEDSLKKLEKIENKDSKVYFLTGSVYLSLNKIELAEKNLLMAYKLNNKNFSILHNLGVINKTKGNLETAKDYFIEALEIQENLELLSEIANIYKELNNYEIAEKYCQMVFKKDKSHQKTNLILSEIYFKNNEIHKALIYKHKATGLIRFLEKDFEII